MGCACGKGGGRTIAQAKQATQRAALVPEGSIESQPILLGDADDTIRRFRVQTTTGNLRAGNAYWLTGTGVAPLIDSGSLVEITGVQQKARLWKVGAFTYSDEGTAKRVAASLGTTPIEVA